MQSIANDNDIPKDQAFRVCRGVWQIIVNGRIKLACWADEASAKAALRDEQRRSLQAVR